jgi:hypothetical protein
MMDYIKNLIFNILFIFLQKFVFLFYEHIFTKIFFTLTCTKYPQFRHSLVRNTRNFDTHLYEIPAISTHPPKRCRSLKNTVTSRSPPKGILLKPPKGHDLPSLICLISSWLAALNGASTSSENLNFSKSLKFFSTTLTQKSWMLRIPSKMVKSARRVLTSTTRSRTVL